MKIKSILIALTAVAVSFSAAGQSLEAQLAGKKPVVMEAPNFKVKKPATFKAIGPVKLVSSKQNDIIDGDEWLRDHSGGQADLINPDNAPAGFPKEIDGAKLCRLVCDNAGGKYIGLYGYFNEEPLRLIITDAEAKTVEHYINFDNFKWPPVKVHYAASNLFGQLARVVDDTLYYSFGHNTYADSTNGMTGYICAIDLNTYKMKWLAGPTVSNSTFDFSYNRIICGYGFTDEPDYLYVLDANSGKYIQRVKLRKGPDYIVVTGDKVYVRTYSYDYIFNIKAGVSGK